MTINVTMYIHEHENEYGHGYGHDAHVCMYTHRDLPKKHVYNIMQSILEEGEKLTRRHPKVDIYFTHLGTSGEDDTLRSYRRPSRPRPAERLQALESARQTKGNARVPAFFFHVRRFCFARGSFSSQSHAQL
jgi:hypothetical protein